MRVVTLVALLLLLACGKSEAPEVAGMEMDRDQVTFNEVGASVAVGARAFDAERVTVEGASLRWWSSNPTVASVSEGGIVTATGDGVARIWASVNGDSVFAVIVVEIARPEIRFAILPTVVQFDALGDTAQFRLEPVGETADSIIPADSLEAYCRATDGAVAFVSEGGLVTSAGDGVTRVRCQVGDASESLRVEVKQRAARVAIISPGDTPGAMSVRLEDDSLPLILARVDRLGAPVENAQPKWMSLDPEVVQIDQASGTVTGLQLGEGRVAAELHGLVDTALIRVREEDLTPVVQARPRVVLRRGRAGARGRATRSARIVAGQPGMVVGARGIEPRDSVFRPFPQLQAVVGTRKFGLTAAVWQAEHRVDVGAGVERTSGLMFGGAARWAPGRLHFTGRLLTGKLTGQSAGVEDRTVNDGVFDIGYRALPWLDFIAGAGLRSYKTPVATQRWTMLRLGGRAQFDLMEGAVQALFEGALLPAITISGQTESPSLGIVSGAGVEYRTGRLVGGVYYRLERYDFARSPLGFDRREQFTAIRFRVGLELGR